MDIASGEVIHCGKHGLTRRASRHRRAAGATACRAALTLALVLAICTWVVWPHPSRAQTLTPVDVWNSSRGSVRADLVRGLNAGNPQILYDTELLTQPLLLWLARQQDTAQSRAILDQLCEIFGVAFSRGYLNQATEPVSKTGYTGWLSYEGSPGEANYGQERFLDSVQFLAAVTAAIRLAARIPATERTGNEQALIVQVPFIVQTYLRWMTGDMRKTAQFDPLDDSTPVYDVSLNLAEGCLNLLDAVQSGGLQVNLPGGLYEYAIQIVWPRLAPSGPYSRVRWYNQTGGLATPQTPGARAVFDATYVPGSLSSNRCAFYEAGAPPASPGDCPSQRRTYPPAYGMTYDLGHSWRLVYLLDSYRRFSDPAIALQATVVTVGLTWQFVSQVWNQDMNNPRFANYFGDSNGERLDGWNGVKFDQDGQLDRSAKTYGPSELGTDIAPLYFAWAEYDPTLQKIAEAFYVKNYTAYYDPSVNWSRALKFTPLHPRFYIIGSGK